MPDTSAPQGTEREQIVEIVHEIMDDAMSDEDALRFSAGQYADRIRALLGAAPSGEPEAPKVDRFRAVCGDSAKTRLQIECEGILTRAAFRADGHRKTPAPVYVEALATEMEVWINEYLAEAAPSEREVLREALRTALDQLASGYESHPGMNYTPPRRLTGDDRKKLHTEAAQILDLLAAAPREQETPCPRCGATDWTGDRCERCDYEEPPAPGETREADGIRKRAAAWREKLTRGDTSSISTAAALGLLADLETLLGAPTGEAARLAEELEQSVRTASGWTGPGVMVYVKRDTADAAACLLRTLERGSEHGVDSDITLTSEER